MLLHHAGLFANLVLLIDRRCTVDTPASASALLIVLQSSKVESCMLKHLVHL